MILINAAALKESSTGIEIDSLWKHQALSWDSLSQKSERKSQ